LLPTASGPALHGVVITLDDGLVFLVLEQLVLFAPCGVSLSIDELVVILGFVLGRVIHSSFVVEDLPESADHGDGLIDGAALEFAWDEVLPYFEGQVDFYFPHNVILILGTGYRSGCKYPPICAVKIEERVYNKLNLKS